MMNQSHKGGGGDRRRRRSDDALQIVCSSTGEIRRLNLYRSCAGSIVYPRDSVSIFLIKCEGKARQSSGGD